MHRSATEVSFNHVAFDKQLQVSGGFNALNYLLDCEQLSYSAYESWRKGDLTTLDDALRVSCDEAALTLQEVVIWAEKIGLQKEAQSWYCWSGKTRQALIPFTHSRLQALCSHCWKPAENRMQLDIFMDNTQVVIENHLCESLAARQWDQAQEACAKLMKLAPQHLKIAHYESLISYGMHMSERPLIPPDELREELHGLEREVAPLATEVLRYQARDYLASAWRRMALSTNECNDTTVLASLREGDAQHQSYAWSQIPDWTRVRDSILSLPETARDFVLCVRLAEAFWHARQPELSLLHYSALFKRDETQAEILFEKGKVVGRAMQYWHDFLAIDEVDLPAVLFSGYVLLREPGLVHLLDDPAAPWAFHSVVPAVATLLRCRGSGKPETAARQALRQLSPSLLKWYLSGRVGGA